MNTFAQAIILGFALSGASNGIASAATADSVKPTGETTQAIAQPSLMELSRAALASISTRLAPTK